MNFYSARLLFVAVVDDGRPRKTHTWDESIVVFHARDFDHALARALEIGRSHETEYLNYRQQRVRWALVKVENVDLVGKRVDGQEVASRLSRRRSKKTIPFGTQFRLEEPEPTQSF
jgi:Domain of unknown function (DUF4288)